MGEKNGEDAVGSDPTSPSATKGRSGHGRSEMESKEEGARREARGDLMQTKELAQRRRGAEEENGREPQWKQSEHGRSEAESKEEGARREAPRKGPVADCDCPGENEREAMEFARVRF